MLAYRHTKVVVNIRLYEYRQNKLK